VEKQDMIGGVVPSSIHNKLNGGKNKGLDESDKADGKKERIFWQVRGRVDGFGEDCACEWMILSKLDK